MPFGRASSARTGCRLTQLHVLGVLSLIVWALILVVTVKYVLITMRADNRGEGGSFALLALISRVAPRARLLPAISLGALLATALFYGDAVITPAISILSAVEGLTLADEKFGVAVVPVTLVITLACSRSNTAALAQWGAPSVRSCWPGSSPSACSAQRMSRHARRVGGGQPHLCCRSDRQGPAARLPDPGHRRA